MRGLGMVVNARAACILLLATWAEQLHHHRGAAKLVGVYLTPHGSLAIEPELFPAKTDEERRQVRGLHEAAVKLGAEIDAADPEVLLVVTPHGIMDPKRYNLYYNPIARGRADIDFCKCPPCCHTMTLAIDVELAQVHGWGKVVLSPDASGRGSTEGYMQRLERFLVEEWGLPVSGVSFMGPPGAAVAPIPLTFAEVVPTSFIAGMNRTELRVNEDDDEGFLSNKPQAGMSEKAAGGGRRALVLALPSRRFHEPVEMMRELLDLGRALYHFLDSTSTRVAVLVSGDGAHTHDPDSAYGYTPEAQVYDDAIVEWIRSRLGHHILRTAASVVATAKSCGFTGWVLSHGIMQASGSPATLWTSQLLTYSHPSYYGVLAAAFRPQPHTPSHRADGDRAARFWQVPMESSTAVTVAAAAFAAGVITGWCINRFAREKLEAILDSLSKHVKKM